MKTNHIIYSALAALLLGGAGTAEASAEVTAISAQAATTLTGYLKIVDKASGTMSIYDNQTVEVTPDTEGTVSLGMASITIGHITLTDISIKGVGYNDGSLSGNGLDVTVKGISDPVKASVTGTPDSFTLTVTVNWGDGDTGTADVMFSTQPIVPVAGDPGVISSSYPGTVTVTAPDPQRDNAVTTYTLPLTISVAYDADGNAGVTIPEMKFCEVEMLPLGRSDEEQDYYYIIPALTVDATVSHSGERTVISREQYNYYIGDKDYFIGLDGSTNADGFMRMTIQLHDPVTDNDIEAIFSNGEMPASKLEGTITASMGGNALLGKGVEAAIMITPKGTGESADFVIPSITLPGIGELGEIKLENVDATHYGEATVDYDCHATGVKIMNGAMTADIDLNGYVDADGNADFQITVVTPVGPVDVRFTGKNFGSSTGIENVEAAIDGASQWYDLRGVRVDGANLAPGVYIERRADGSTVKRLVR